VELAAANETVVRVVVDAVVGTAGDGGVVRVAYRAANTAADEAESAPPESIETPPPMADRLAL
jgi:hypothetical protein